MSEPYTVRLDADTARELATKGSTIVLLDVPEGTVIGMDQQTFLVGPKFKGIKMVPPGIHVISYAAADSQGGYGPTTAFFVRVRGGEVAPWRWQPSEEILQRITDESDTAALHNAVKSFQFDQNLAPYDLASYPIWRQLSGHITQRTLDAVAPIGGNINVLAEAGAAGGAVPTAAELAMEEALTRGRAARAEQPSSIPPSGVESASEKQELSNESRMLAAPHAGRCFFTPLPRLVKRPGLSAAQLTALNLDKSTTLEELLASKFKGNEDDFLGEFQFAFLAFLLGHSLEGFSQWKEFLRLMMGCEEAALGSRVQLFTAFLQALHAQLLHTLAPGCSAEAQAAPLGTPMVEELLADSFLRRLCTGWLRWVASEGSAVPQPLSDAATSVSVLLQRAVGWECGPLEELGGGGGDDEDDDDGPVVVEGVDV